MATDYLGTATHYPLRMSGGAVATASGADAIAQSVFQILATPVGTRLMLPEYGSRLDELVFNINDTATHALVKAHAIDALSRWEKRARFISASVRVSVDILWLEVRAIILSSNEVQSFVYPHYSRLVN